MFHESAWEAHVLRSFHGLQVNTVMFLDGVLKVCELYYASMELTQEELFPLCPLWGLKGFSEPSWHLEVQV